MDTRGIDRPAVVVLAGPCDVVSALILVLAEQGYDVHLPQDMVPGPVEHQDHPRLHPVPVAADDAAEELVAAVQRSGSPLAFVLCAVGDDLLARSRLVLGLRRSLRRSGVLVIGDPDFPDRPAQVAGVRVAWLTPGWTLPAPLPRLRLLGRRGGVTTAATRTARRGLDGLVHGRTVISCSPSLLQARVGAGSGGGRR